MKASVIFAFVAALGSSSVFAAPATSDAVAKREPVDLGIANIDSLAALQAKVVQLNSLASQIKKQSDAVKDAKQVQASVPQLRNTVGQFDSVFGALFKLDASAVAGLVPVIPPTVGANALALPAVTSLVGMYLSALVSAVGVLNSVGRLEGILAIAGGLNIGLVSSLLDGLLGQVGGLLNIDILAGVIGVIG